MIEQCDKQKSHLWLLQSTSSHFYTIINHLMQIGLLHILFTDVATVHPINRNAGKTKGG
jgi:hypothetical protein